MKKLLLVSAALICLLLMVTSCSSPTVEYIVDDSYSDFGSDALRRELGLDIPIYQRLFSSSSPQTIRINSSTKSSEEVLSGLPTEEAAMGETEPTEFFQQVAADTTRMIVRTGDIHMIVGDILFTLDQISGLAESTDGYVVSSNKWKESGVLVGTISIRVPAETFEDTMRVLRELAIEVEYDATESTDVTEEYIDLKARLGNLEAAEDQLLVIMQKAKEVQDILEVQRELTSTRGEIESIKGRINYLEQTSQTSLITVALVQSKLGVKLGTIGGGRYVIAGEPIHFIAEISGGFAPYTYQWDFGDGTTSNQDIPSHTYTSSGNFTVSVLVTDDRGSTEADTRTDYITVRSGWDIGNVARSAWVGLRWFGKVLINTIIWLGIFSPVLASVGFILYRVRRKIKNRKKAKS